MRTWARRIRDVSGERQRIEFHKLLMGDDPAKALRIGATPACSQRCSPSSRR